MNWEPQLRRAPNGAHAEYQAAAAHKLLSENRDRYIRQSADTEAGKLAELPPRKVEWCHAE